MSSFDPSRVKLVDSVNKSHLIRGPIPLLSDGKTFPYYKIEELTGVDLKSTMLTVISLIDCTGEHEMLAAELATFNLPDLWSPSYWPPYTKQGYNSKNLYGKNVKSENGEEFKANLIWWPIEGLALGQDPTEFLNWPGWNLRGLVDYIHFLLVGDIDRSVYVHCSLGADRTGAAIACYFMKYHGLNAKQALDLVSKQTSAGSPNQDYVRLIESYYP